MMLCSPQFLAAGSYPTLRTLPADCFSIGFYSMDIAPCLGLPSCSPRTPSRKVPIRVACCMPLSANAKPQNSPCSNSALSHWYSLARSTHWRHLPISHASQLARRHWTFIMANPLRTIPSIELTKCSRLHFATHLERRGALP
jgi:hypothetical protein